jgi:branched-chain amino acid transport system substrate-binding protein
MAITKTREGNMKESKGNTSKHGISRISRRDFVKQAALGVGTMTAAGTVPALWRTAQAADVLKVGFVSPLTGPLAGFGEGDPYIVDLVKRSLAKGLVSGGKTYEVQLIAKDTQSDPVRASQLAKDLINGDKIDLMLSTSTPEVVNPVADACEAAGVPSLSTIMPWEAFYFGRGAKPGAPSPFKWTYLFSFGVAEFANAYISMWQAIETNKKVGVMYPNDADGNAIRAHLAPALEKAGYHIIDPGGFEDGTTDYSSQIALFKKEKCEIFNTFPIPPDFATFWRQAAQQGYTKTVKIAQIAKTGLFPSQVESLGALGYNLASACYWHKTFPYKSLQTGFSSQEIADGYEKATGKQWQQQLGATMSLFDAGFAALKSAPDAKNKADVANAIAHLNAETMVGRVDFNKGPVPNCVGTPIIGGQWVKTGGKFKIDFVVCDNADDKNVPVGGKLHAYNA